MKTQRNASRFIAAALALVLAGCASGETPSNSMSADTSTGVALPTTTVPPTSETTETYYTATPTNARPPTQAQTPPVPTTTNRTLAPEGNRQSFFGFNLPLADRWVVDDKMSNDARKVIIDSSRCGSMDYAANCPGFVVVNFNTTNDWMPYDNKKGFIEKTTSDGKKCYWNMVQDGVYYNPPETADVVMFGGVTLRHTTQRACAGTDIMHSWRSDKKKVMFYELDTSSPLPSVGVEEVLYALKLL